MSACARIVGLLLALGGVSFAAEHEGQTPHWGYAGKLGPEHWSTLDAKFSACAGRNQSPIDLDGFIEAQLPPIRFDYRNGGRDILNNGHTVQVDYDGGSSISIDHDVFALKQFHFHAPSENHIAGKGFPIEAHFVHADAQGNLAVVAVMFVQGASNRTLESLWTRLPSREGEELALSPEIGAMGLLP
ncbi:MAG: carbonic anhydrase, partial [Luteimonas sp.]